MATKRFDDVAEKARALKTQAKKLRREQGMPRGRRLTPTRSWRFSLK